MSDDRPKVKANLLTSALAWVFLPAGAFWGNVTGDHGKVLVWGYAQQGNGCFVLTVDPRSRHTSLSSRNCAHTTSLLTPDVGLSTVRVGGRLAFRYSDSSDAKVAWAYGGGSLWVYDVATTNGPMLLRYSLHTARLQQRVPFPRLFKPVLAANDAGAWLMANPSGGISGERTASLYVVTPHARRPRIAQRGARAALWMTAHGNALWLETVTGLHTFKLWRYVGVRGRVLWTKQQSTLSGTSYGAGALWGVSAAYCGERVHALRIDALTGATRVVANVPLLDCNQFGAGSYYRGWFWFVDGDKLYRVR
jgi:hypothetical protein